MPADNPHDTVEEILRRHDAAVRKELRRCATRIASLERQITSLRHVVVSGENHDYPWTRLSPARAKLVQRVAEYLREHPTVNIPRACQATFTPLPGGYPSWQALRSYCYSIEIVNYLQ